MFLEKIKMENIFGVSCERKFKRKKGKYFWSFGLIFLKKCRKNGKRAMD